MKTLLSLALLFMLAACGSTGGSSSTVTVGGRQIEVPEVTVDEHQRLIDTIGIYDDPETAAYINAIGQRLVANSSRRNDTFTFTLLDSTLMPLPCPVGSFM